MPARRQRSTSSVPPVKQCNTVRSGTPSAVEHVEQVVPRVARVDDQAQDRARAPARSARRTPRAARRAGRARSSSRGRTPRPRPATRRPRRTAPASNAATSSTPSLASCGCSPIGGPCPRQPPRSGGSPAPPERLARGRGARSDADQPGRPLPRPPWPRPLRPGPPRRVGPPRPDRPTPSRQVFLLHMAVRVEPGPHVRPCGAGNSGSPLTTVAPPSYPPQAPPPQAGGRRRGRPPRPIRRHTSAAVDGMAGAHQDRHDPQHLERIAEHGLDGGAGFHLPRLGRLELRVGRADEPPRLLERLVRGPTRPRCRRRLEHAPPRRRRELARRVAGRPDAAALRVHDRRDPRHEVAEVVRQVCVVPRHDALRRRSRRRLPAGRRAGGGSAAGRRRSPPPAPAERCR